MVRGCLPRTLCHMQWPGGRGLHSRAAPPTLRLTCTVRRGRRPCATGPGRTSLVQPGWGACGLAWAPAWLIAGPALCPGHCAACRPGLASSGPGHRRARLLQYSPSGCIVQPAGLIHAYTGPGNLALPFLCHTGPESAGPALCLPHRAS